MEEGGDRVDTSYRMQPSQAIVEAVARAEGVPATELCPPEYEALHDVIDPTALDALFAPTHSGFARGEGTVTFDFCGYTVAVTSDGDVSVD